MSLETKLKEATPSMKRLGIFLLDAGFFIIFFLMVVALIMFLWSLIDSKTWKEAEQVIIDPKVAKVIIFIIGFPFMAMGYAAGRWAKSPTIFDALRRIDDPIDLAASNAALLQYAKDKGWTKYLIKGE